MMVAVEIAPADNQMSRRENTTRQARNTRTTKLGLGVGPQKNGTTPAPFSNL
jgi:hypothetical protein